MMRIIAASLVFSILCLGESHGPEGATDRKAGRAIQEESAVDERRNPASESVAAELDDSESKTLDEYVSALNQGFQKPKLNKTGEQEATTANP